MKKQILIIALVIFSLKASHAQSDKGDITLEPRIGVNFANYFSEAGYGNRTSFAGGAVFEYYFSDRWSFRSGLLFDPMGAEDDFDNVDKLNYLTLPLNANWHFGKKRNWYLNFGPAVAFLLGAETELADNGTIDIKDLVPSTDFGLAFGIGYKFDISENIQLVIDYQEYLGLINLDEAGNLPYDIRNSRGAFNVGVVIGL